MLIFFRGYAPPQDTTSLGAVPHQLLGFLAQWKTLTVKGEAYDKCSARSDMVVSKYKEEGFDFILEVLNRPEVLEEITGMKKEKEKECVIEWISTSEDDF